MKTIQKYKQYHAEGEGRLSGDLLAGIVGAMAYQYQGFLLVFISIIILDILGFMIDRKGWDEIDQNPMVKKAQSIEG